jgi:hypothetical protein
VLEPGGLGGINFVVSDKPAILQQVGLIAGAVISEPGQFFPLPCEEYAVGAVSR